MGSNWVPEHLTNALQACLEEMRFLYGLSVVIVSYASATPVILAPIGISQMDLVQSMQTRNNECSV